MAFMLMRVAGIVDHDVDPAESAFGSIDHGLDVRLDGDIRGNGDRRCADLAGDALGALGIEIGDDDSRALFGKAHRHALAEAGSGTGYDGDLVF
jgi:hypothetical protein